MSALEEQKCPSRTQEVSVEGKWERTMFKLLHLTCLPFVSWLETQSLQVARRVRGGRGALTALHGSKD